ncbi:hypothetical protein [Polluticoccus soli]|uniref:transmembrane-type terpene cyclase n=1 Tax=Polluticoccus soli TaxID=3034150 RepID=UPI0023E2FDCD|nr:hypothetical protein [Flavipsychrobacter sp. JY13-12]
MPFTDTTRHILPTDHIQNLVDYIRTPHPWVDTTYYELPVVIIFFCAAMFWVWAYIDTIRGIIKKKTIGVPVVAICLNFGYEVTAAFFFLPDMGKAVVFGYVGWLVLDLYIVIHAFRYGDKQIRNPYIKKNFKTLFLVGLVMAFTAEYLFMTNYDIPIAVFDAYIINLIMSVSFIYLVFVPGFEGNSLVTAWTKFLGTGLTSVAFLLHYHIPFLTTLYVGCAVFDIYYIYLLYQKRKGALAYAIR